MLGKPFAWRLLVPIILLLAGLALRAGAAGTAPLRMDVEPAKQIYTDREGLMVKFILTAREKTKLCLEKDPLSQMRITVSRSGQGKVPLEPLVLRDNRVLFDQNMKVRWLNPGDRVYLRANLKRLRFSGGGRWEPGEYSVSAVFNLCEQTPNEEVNDLGKEIPIPTARPGWFMIMI